MLCGSNYSIAGYQSKSINESSTDEIIVLAYVLQHIIRCGWRAGMKNLSHRKGYFHQYQGISSFTQILNLILCTRMISPFPLHQCGKMANV